MFGLAALFGLLGSIFDVKVDRYWEDDPEDDNTEDNSPPYSPGPSWFLWDWVFGDPDEDDPLDSF